VTLSDSELISRVLASDDRAAFSVLVIRHQSTVRRFLRHLTRGDTMFADDLAQETFVQAYRGLSRFRGEGTFSTWLLGIAYNHSRNARRRQRDHALLNENTPDPHSGSATQSSDLRHDLANALGELSADEQLAIHLGYQQGKSHSEIAALVDWPLGTVKTHLARGKEKLRHLLSAWNPQI
jgi:RNA polymerase sigma-70 factor (ECF subfamily)